MASDRTKERLTGPGAGYGVVRIGDTIRRPRAGTPQAMLDVLAHLETVGFAGAPRYKGRDSAGRFILSYIPGDVATHPFPAWVLTEPALVSVARLLRRYHDAVSNFHLTWNTTKADPPYPLGPGIAAHLDVSMTNVVFQDGLAVALIDFEEVAVAPVLVDVVRAARHWCPLIDPTDLRAGLEPLAGKQLQRLSVFVNAYALSPEDRRSFATELLANMDRTYARMRDGAAMGHAGYVREWHGPHAKRNRRARYWAVQHINAIQNAAMSQGTLM